MSRKVPVTYETRYGATEGTSEEIVEGFRGKGLDIRVVNSSFEMAMPSY